LFRFYSINNNNSHHNRHHHNRHHHSHSAQQHDATEMFDDDEEDDDEEDDEDGFLPGYDMWVVDFFFRFDSFHLFADIMLSFNPFFLF
jgi:hypothetical protein